MTRLFVMLLLLGFASQGFTDLSVEAQKKRLMGQIVAAEDPIIREKLQGVYEAIGQENSEIYIECVLKNMKGVANDFAAKAVESACRLKQESSIAQYEQVGKPQADIKTIVVSDEKTEAVSAPSVSVTPTVGPSEQVGSSDLAGYEPTDKDRRYLSKLGEAVAAQEKIWREAGRLIQNKELLAYINTVLSKLAPEEKAAEFINFRITIFDDPQFLRGSLADGRIFLSTGLLVSLGGENDLARVLADQVAHIQLFHDLLVEDVEEKLKAVLQFRPEDLSLRSYSDPLRGLIGGTPVGYASALFSGVRAATDNRDKKVRWDVQVKNEADARDLAGKLLYSSGYKSLKPAIAHSFTTGLADVKGEALDSRLHTTFPNGLLPDSIGRIAVVRSSYDPEYQELIWPLTKKAILWASEFDYSSYLFAISKGSEKQLREDAQSSFLVADAYADSYLNNPLSESMRLAENWYLNSARLEPENPVILQRMGEVYYRLDKPKEAARAFIQYLKSGDTSVDRDLVLGRLRAIKENLLSAEAENE